MVEVLGGIDCLEENEFIGIFGGGVVWFLCFRSLGGVVGFILLLWVVEIFMGGGIMGGCGGIVVDLVGVKCVMKRLINLCIEFGWRFVFFFR